MRDTDQSQYAWCSPHKPHDPFQNLIPSSPESWLLIISFQKSSQLPSNSLQVPLSWTGRSSFLQCLATLLLLNFLQTPQWVPGGNQALQFFFFFFFQTPQIVLPDLDFEVLEFGKVPLLQGLKFFTFSSFFKLFLFFFLFVSYSKWKFICCFSLFHGHPTINNQSFNHQSKFMINWVHAQIIQHQLWLWMNWLLAHLFMNSTINNQSSINTHKQICNFTDVCMYVCYSTLLQYKINHSQAFYFLQLWLSHQVVGQFCFCLCNVYASWFF